MKKLLSILASVGLTATASTAVVSCADSNTTNPNLLFPKPDNTFDNSKVSLSGATLQDDGVTVTVTTGTKMKIAPTVDDVVIFVNSMNGSKPIKTWCKNVVESKDERSFSIALREPAVQGQELGLYVDGFKTKDTISVKISDIPTLSFGNEEYLNESYEDFSNGFANIKIPLDTKTAEALDGVNLNDYLHIGQNGEVDDDNVVIDHAVGDKEGYISLDVVVTRNDINIENGDPDHFTITGSGLLKGSFKFNITGNYYGSVTVRSWWSTHGYEGQAYVYDVKFTSAKALTWKCNYEYNYFGNNIWYLQSENGGISGYMNTNYDGKIYTGTLTNGSLRNGDKIYIEQDEYSPATNEAEATYSGPSSTWIGSQIS